MIRTVLLVLIMAMAGVQAQIQAQADTKTDAKLKIINFTAEWCPNCQILNPAIRNALLEFPAGEIEVINLDMTHAGRRASPEQKLMVHADAIRLAQRHKAGHLWERYGGVTGLAAIVAADTGEAIGCMTRVLSSEDIAYGLRESLIITARRAPGERMPNGADCP